MQIKLNFWINKENNVAIGAGLQDINTTQN